MTKETPDKITMYAACLLHSRADRALRLIIARQLEQFNVTMMEWLLIGAVAQNEKTGTTMSDVATRLDVTLPQVTALAMSLVKAKLLKQKISREDRRSRKLYCSPAALRLLKDIEKVLDDTIQELVEDIPQDQLLGYLEVIQKLADRKPGRLLA